MPGYSLSAKAKADLKSIYKFSEETFGRTQAARYFSAIDAKLKLIARNPEIGRTRSDVDERTRSFSHGSHVIFYEIRARDIFVLRVLHAAQDPSRHFGE